MAKMVITIEDLDGGRVKVVSEPSFENLMQATVANKLTAAQGYGIALLNKAREISKSNSPNRILIPRLKPGRMQ